MARPLLYVIPHAGGAAYAYQPLVEALAPEVEVCCLELPGHGRRAREKPLGSFREMIDDLLAEMHPASNRVWAIFGHSMGALLGHAICRRICRHHLKNRPSYLFVSGASYPGRGRGVAISHLPGKQFWEKVAEFGGLPDELQASSELREYFGNILRHDFRAVETYESGNDRLNVPIAVFYGADDMSRKEADSWQAVTMAECRTYAFSGGHFFLFNALRQISHRIRQALQRSVLSL